MNDPFNLERFVRAQEPVIGEVLAELRRGRKESHWIWFIFPQLQGLGRSWMAEEYGIASPDEAKAYLAHAVLNPRLIECTRLVLEVEGSSIEQIFGSVDAMKFRSSMTLFGETADAGTTLFADALRKYFAGEPDRLTLNRLRGGQ